MYSIRILLIALLWTLLPAASHAQAGFEPGDRLPADPAVLIDSLDNGLRYYIRANAHPENRAELRLVINAGSILEDDDQRGLAHFVEHMAFNGTRNFEQQDLVRYLESIGMRFGADLNAYTSFDETVYMLTVPTDREEVLSTAFQILADWADGITFDPGEIEKERGVVIEEWRSRLGAASRTSDAQYPVLLGGSRYADRLPIGQIEILESFEEDALIRFYDKWYRTDLMAVIAVGDFDPAVVEALVIDHFGAVQAPDQPLSRPVFPVPPQEDARFLSYADPELTTTRVDIIHKLDWEETATVADYGRLLSGRLYNTMFNARLAEITRRPGAPFVAASSGRGNLVRGVGAYTIAAIVPDGGAEVGIEALLVEAERVGRHGFTQTEVDRGRLNLLRALERAYAERARTNSASFAGEYIRHFLSGEPIPGIEFEFELAGRLLPDVTVGELNRLARAWLPEVDRVVFVSAPRRDEGDLPDVDDLRRVLAGVSAIDVDPYVDSTVDEPLMSVLPAGSPVVREIRHESVDVVEWHLGNGVSVYLKVTDFRDDEILLRGWGPGGLSLADDDALLSASFATNVVQTGGLGPFSANDLRHVLAGKAASAAPLLGETEQGVTGSASPRDLETMLQMVYLYFTAPRFDEEAVAAMSDQLRVALANRDADPSSAFSDTLQAVLSGNNPRFRPLTTDRLPEIDFGEAFDFYRDRFSDASGFKFVLIGNIDIQQVGPLIETYLGGLPAGGQTDAWLDRAVPPPGGIVQKIVRRGLEPRAQTRVVFTDTLEYSRESAHLLRSLGSLLELRLREALREDLGGTYGVSVSASASRQPRERYSVSIAFGGSPDRIDELVASMFGEIERVATDGPTPAELASIQEIQRRERETSLRQNGYWATQLAALDREGADLAEILTYETWIESLDADSLRSAALRWLPSDRYIQVTLLPE